MLSPLKPTHTHILSIGALAFFLCSCSTATLDKPTFSLVSDKISIVEQGGEIKTEVSYPECVLASDKVNKVTITTNKSEESPYGYLANVASAILNLIVKIFIP